MSDPESSTSAPEEKSPAKEEEEEEEDNKDTKDSENEEAEETPAPKKSPKKAKKKSNSDDENSAEEKNGEEDSDEDKPVGLLDRPVEIQSGHRERKKVERLEMNFNVTPKDKKVDIPEGKGEKLGDCPRIEFQLQKIKADELKIFHRILFNRPGTTSEIKRNIRRFSGFTFKSDSSEYERKEANLAKLTTNNLKQICEVLDLERGGTKEDLTSRILEFLMKPKSSGKALPKAKKSKSPKVEKSEKRKSNSKKRPKRDSKKSRPNLKESEDESESEKSVKEESEEEKDDGNENEDNEEEEEEEEKKSENSDEEPPKKKIKSMSKTSNKKEKTEKKVNTKRKKGSSGEESDSSDDEPLVKKVKAPPSDSELKDIIKKILDGANLEEVTMKSVCKQVYAKYPDHDLTSRKDFIKATVKTIIS